MSCSSGVKKTLTRATCPKPNDYLFSPLTVGEIRLLIMRTTRQTSISEDSTDPVFCLDSTVSIGEFREMVLAYYRKHGRDLPWRRTTDPYHILVSEIMLQQTQVSRVMEKYPRFIDAFPDLPSLAAAPLPELLAAWQGMGYNRRALALKKSAGLIVEEFEGNLPADPGVLATFPGIGKATAASICAFAFNLPVVFIETNIRRVFLHYFFRERSGVSDNEIYRVAGDALYREDPRRWYNALMDLGTDLKTKVPNPNRRSTTYSIQPGFEGSDRKIRGAILRLLLGTPRLTTAAIAAHLSCEDNRIGRILQNLDDEGFIVCEENSYSIRSR